MSHGLKLVLLTALLLGCLNGGSAWAVGSRGLGNQSIGAYALGQANAVAARAEDPSANFFNPAALSFMQGLQVSGGVNMLIPQYSHKDQSGVSEDAASNTFYVPNVFLSGNIGDLPISWGIGATSPFGLGTEWSSTGFAKYVATKSDLKVMHFNPNVSYLWGDHVSMAVGIDYMYSDVTLNRQVSVAAVNAPPFDPSTPDGTFRLEGNGGGWGYNAAMMWAPRDGQKVGLSYRSKINMTAEGTAKLSGMSGNMALLFGGTSYSTSGESELRYPDSVTAGYSFLVGPKLTVETDLEWTGWSTFKEQKINYTGETDPTRLSVLNNGNPQPREWNDVLSAAIGAQYSLNPHWQLRTGYMYMDSPVPNKTYEPSVPDADLHGIALGAGYKLNNLAVDIAYLANIFPTRHTTSTMGAPLSDVSGDYSSFAHSLALSLGYKF